MSFNLIPNNFTSVQTICGNLRFSITNLTTPAEIYNCRASLCHIDGAADLQTVFYCGSNTTLIVTNKTKFEDIEICADGACSQANGSATVKVTYKLALLGFAALCLSVTNAL